LNVLLGILIIIAGIWTQTMQTDSHLLFWLGITYPGYTALDYYPLLPWFGFVLIGIYTGQTILPDGKPRSKIATGDSTPMRVLSFLGRNSLAIYLAHQPVIFAVLALWKTLTG
jgi:uncharacterized membrane protein